MLDKFYSFSTEFLLNKSIGFTSFSLVSHLFLTAPCLFSSPGRTDVTQLKHKSDQMSTTGLPGPRTSVF